MSLDAFGCCFKYAKKSNNLCTQGDIGCCPVSNQHPATVFYNSSAKALDFQTQSASSAEYIKMVIDIFISLNFSVYGFGLYYRKTKMQQTKINVTSNLSFV